MSRLVQTLTILAADTSGGQSSSFEVPENNHAVVICSPSLGVGETAQIQITHDNGDTFADYYDGALVELNQDRNAIRLLGPGEYRVNKGATASSVGIYLQR